MSKYVRNVNTFPAIGILQSTIFLYNFFSPCRVLMTVCIPNWKRPRNSVNTFSRVGFCKHISSIGILLINFSLYNFVFTFQSVNEDNKYLLFYLQNSKKDALDHCSQFPYKFLWYWYFGKPSFNSPSKQGLWFAEQWLCVLENLLVAICRECKRKDTLLIRSVLICISNVFTSNKTMLGIRWRAHFISSQWCWEMI